MSAARGVRGGPAPPRPRELMLGLIGVGLALAGGFMALRATNAADRWMGLACTVFFGLGAVLPAMLRRVARGSRATLSPALRIGADRRKNLDRLALPVAPARIAITAGAGLFFLPGVAIGVLAMGGIAGMIVAAGAAALALCGFGGALMMLARRTPPIVLETGSLTFGPPLGPRTTVRYRDIRGFSVVSVSSAHLVAIEIDEIAAALRHASSARARGRLATNQRFFGAPYILPNTTALSAEQLIALIVEYIEAAADEPRSLPHPNGSHGGPLGPHDGTFS